MQQHDSRMRRPLPAGSPLAPVDRSRLTAFSIAAVLACGFVLGLRASSSGPSLWSRTGCFAAQRLEPTALPRLFPNRGLPYVVIRRCRRRRGREARCVIPASFQQRIECRVARI